jgi:hypothetical protein
MNRKLVGAILLAGALMVSAGLANAAGSYSANLTITATRDAATGGYLIRGTLTSPNKACVKKRLVKVYLSGVPGHAKAVATSSGKWALTNYLIGPGQYYAQVDKLKVAKGSCKGAKSKTITGAA